MEWNILAEWIKNINYTDVMHFSCWWWSEGGIGEEKCNPSKLNSLFSRDWSGASHNQTDDGMSEEICLLFKNNNIPMPLTISF